MKIRIKGNSLRYRLTKSDIEHFSKDGYIEETIYFGTQKLIYALQRYQQDELTADFNDQKIVLYVPDYMANEWATTDRVGFENSNSALYLLIEKDLNALIMWQKIKVTIIQTHYQVPYENNLPSD